MKFTKGINEEESLDAESGKVVALLSALPRVEAPSNFEFGVKAKIAQGAPRSGGSLIPFLKLAAPLSLLLIVGAFVFFYATLPSRDNVATVEQTTPATPTQQEQAASVEPSTPPTAERSDVSGPQVRDEIDPEPERATATSPVSPMNRSVPRRNSNSKERDGGLSTVETYKVAPVIMPPGTEGANPATRGGADIPVKEVLGILGVNADFADRGWKVSSVTDNSVAARSGLKPNDVIEAIDGKDMKADSTVKGDSGVRSVRIRRDGKQIELTMKY